MKKLLTVIVVKYIHLFHIILLKSDNIFVDWLVFINVLNLIFLCYLLKAFACNSLAYVVKLTIIVK